MLRAVTSRISQRAFVSPAVPSAWGPAQPPSLAIRLISTTGVVEGERRKHKDYSRYPRARARRPDRPEKVATAELMQETNGLKGEKLVESIKITDDEINKIYESIITPEQRQQLDRLSMKHMSRAEFLESRRKNRENQYLPVEEEKTLEKAVETEKGAERAPQIATISDSSMENMVYIDTRAVREMEEAKRAVITTMDSASVSKLREKVRSNAPTERRLEEETSDNLDETEEGGSTDLVSELTLDEFNYAIYANTLAGRVNEATEAFELMREAGIKPDQTTFANLTVAHAKAGDLESAISMFKRLESEGLEPNMHSYGTLIRAYMEFDRVDDAFRVYETMKKREIWPSLPIYNSLIVSCLKVGDLKRAWGVFEHLRYAIAQPDEVSFTIMIHACAKNGEVEKAMNLFDEMVSNKLALTDVTFNSLIHACSLRPDYFDEGFRLLQLMEAHGFQPDFYTYNTLIYACARKKNLGLARSIFRDMLQQSLQPKNQGLIKIDSVTIANMLWAYSSYLDPVKNCSWKVAKSYENLAMGALEATQTSEKQGNLGRLGQIMSKADSAFVSDITSAALVEAQAKAAEIGRSLAENKTAGSGSDDTNKMLVELIDALMPGQLPSKHNAIGSEATRLMAFYLDIIKGNVTSQLLNAYISAMINNGRFYEAWRTFLSDFKQFNVQKDGWTFQRMIRLCARTRDVPSAWRVWDEYKAWRVAVEKELQTPGSEDLTAGSTKLYKTDTGNRSFGNSEAGDIEALNTASQDMMALAKGLEFPGENALPACVAGGALAVLPADRETARRRVGCDMKVEHATYIEMITLLGSCGDFRAAIQLIREEKNDILEHPHTPNMEDVNSLYQNAVVAGDKASALDIRGLCMRKPLNAARRALHRKWGTSYSWDLTDPQHRSLSRRFPEEFRRHQRPFKDGEYVVSRRK
ncbi:hypothetical protein EC988_000058 [Linderina pennispora]|nr:hypothetical protein EC988_000058 [Linderina pennispora]